MNYQVLFVLSTLFSCIPLLGELFLFFSTGTFNPTIFAALGIAALLMGNLLAFRFHNRLIVSKIIFCAALTVGVSVAIAADGGIRSPLWFFQLLVIVGAGIVFGKVGSLTLGIFTILMAVIHYKFMESSVDTYTLGNFTSLVASSAVFTALSYFYEHEKEKVINKTNDLLVAYEELRQFSYRTSHDLKGPLVSIRGLANLIVEDLDDGDVDEAALNAKRISERSESLEKLIVDILDLAKTDVADSAASPLDLPELVKQITDRMSPTDMQRPVEIKTEFSHTDTIVLPQVRITQILENLISNAVRYSDPAEAEPYVKIATVDRAHSVELTVQDNGLGISEEYVDRLFGMFQRFHPKVASGSGLGLYIVKKHVEKLGADIKYQRTKEGSLFTLTLERTLVES